MARIETYIGMVVCPDSVIIAMILARSRSLRIAYSAAIETPCVASSASTAAMCRNSNQLVAHRAAG